MTQIAKIENENFLIKSSLKEKISDYAKHAFAKNTIRGYRADWNHFSQWCKLANFDPENLNPEVLTVYITDLAEEKYKASTIQRKLSAILKYCKVNKIKVDFDNEEFKTVWQGIRRKLGIAKQGKDPLLIKTLREILDAIPRSSNMGIRDRALLSFGWASAMRRSEIVQLEWNDIEFIEEGILVRIKQSKTDKYGEGQKIAIIKGKNTNTCPVRNLKMWKERHNEGFVFCSVSKSDNITGKQLYGIDVARIIKKWIRKIGLDDTGFAGHSLRSGLITTASKHSVPDYVIMKHTRHKTAQMIHVYTRDNSLINDNVTSMLGL